MANLKRTREDILESVIDTVHRKGLSATGLSELFKLSGASSGSFYNYFGSKHELGHALIDYEWQKLQESVIRPAAENCTDPIERVFWMLDRLEAKQQAEPMCMGCLLGNLIVDLVEQDESFREHLAVVFDAWQEAIANSLRAAKRELSPEVEPNILAEEILTTIEGAMLMGKLRRNSDYIKRGFDSARRLLKASLRSPSALAFSRS
jgi:TetR/AcrR family transcriptional repressor of nem operon